MAYVKDKKTKETRIIHFGASDYEQFKDSTGVGKYTRKNHGNPKEDTTILHDILDFQIKRQQPLKK